MKRFITLVSAAICLLSAQSAAQCATFDITTELDPAGTFQTVTLDVSGSAPLAPTFLVIGETAGSTSITVLGDTLDLGLLGPFAVSPLGATDATGGLTSSIELPPDLGLTLFAQSVTIGFDFTAEGPTISFCESNVGTIAL